MQIFGGNPGYRSYKGSVILSPSEALQEDILPEHEQKMGTAMKL